MSYLKKIFKNPENSPEKIKKMELLKEKIDSILENGNYDCDNIFLDYSYADSNLFDCIVYYSSGYKLN